MSKSVRIHETDGPEVLRWEDVEVGPPGPGQARLRQMAVGVNYIDIYHRSGLYPVPALPAIIGIGGPRHRTRGRSHPAPSSVRVQVRCSRSAA